MILQLPAQIVLSLLTQAHKKMFHISGCVKGVVARQRGQAKRGQAEQSCLLALQCCQHQGDLGKVAVVGEPPHGVTSFRVTAHHPLPRPCRGAGPHQHFISSHSSGQWGHSCRWCEHTFSPETALGTDASLGEEPTAFAQPSERDQISCIHCYFRILPLNEIVISCNSSKVFFSFNQQNFQRALLKNPPIVFLYPSHCSLAFFTRLPTTFCRAFQPQAVLQNH